MKVMPAFGARLGQGGVLGEEAVAGVDGVGAGPDRDGDDRVRVEVGAHRVPALADLVGLVGLEPVLGPAVLVGEDRHRAGADLVRRAEGPDRDLAAVGHEHLGEHGATLVRSGGVAAGRVRMAQTAASGGAPGYGARNWSTSPGTAPAGERDARRPRGRRAR